MSEIGSEGQEVMATPPDREKSAYKLSPRELFDIIKEAPRFTPRDTPLPPDMSSDERQDAERKRQEEHDRTLVAERNHLVVDVGSSSFPDWCPFCEHEEPSSVFSAYVTDSPEGITPNDKNKSGDVGGKKIERIDVSPIDIHTAEQHPDFSEKQFFDRLRTVIAVSRGEEIGTKDRQEMHERSDRDVLTIDEIDEIISNAPSYESPRISQRQGFSPEEHDNLQRIADEEYAQAFDAAHHRIAVIGGGGTRGLFPCSCGLKLPDSKSEFAATNNPAGFSYQDRPVSHFDGNQLIFEIPGKQEIKVMGTVLHSSDLHALQYPASHPQFNDSHILDSLRDLIAFSKGEEVRPRPEREREDEFPEYVAIKKGDRVLGLVPKGTSEEEIAKIRKKLKEEKKKKKEK